MRKHCKSSVIALFHIKAQFLTYTMNIGIKWQEPIWKNCGVYFQNTFSGLFLFQVYITNDASLYLSSAIMKGNVLSWY